MNIRRLILLQPALCVMLAGCSNAGSTADPGASLPAGGAPDPLAKAPAPPPFGASVGDTSSPPGSADAPQPAERGKAPDPQRIESVSAALSRPNGTEVTLAGELVEKCPSEGCWFVLKDSTGKTTVDIEEAGFRVLDVAPGKRMTVRGSVIRRGERTLLVGAGLRLDP